MVIVTVIVDSRIYTVEGFAFTTTNKTEWQLPSPPRPRPSSGDRTGTRASETFVRSACRGSLSSDRTVHHTLRSVTAGVVVPWTASMPALA
jgi:hypothetical protein